MLKLGFKMELLYSYLKSHGTEQSLLTNSENKKSVALLTKNVEKHSFRNSNSHSKVGFSNENDNQTLYESEVNKLSSEEKEEYLNKIKNYESNLLLSMINIIQNKQLYSKLKNKAFMEILRKYYNDSILKEGITEISNECEFYMCFRDTFNMTEFEACEIYDLFKYNENFSFTEQTFVTLVYLFAASESHQTEEAFKLFSDELFSMVNGEEQIMSLNRLKDFGRILGIKEKTLRKVSIDLKLEVTSSIELDKFKQFYISATNLHDEQGKPSIPNPNSGAMSLKKSNKFTTNMLNKIHI